MTIYGTFNIIANRSGIAPVRLRLKDSRRINPLDILRRVWSIYHMKMTTKGLDQNRPLSPSMLLFAERYVATADKKKSAVEAGYSPRTAKARANQLLQDPRIKALVDKARKEAMDNAVLDATDVLNHLSKMLNADIGDILDELGHFKQIHEWPKIWRQMLTAVDVQKLYGAESEVIGEVLKAKFTDRLKAIELLGKHVGVNAFKADETHIHLHQGQINEALTEGRARVSAGRSLPSVNTDTPKDSDTTEAKG